MLLTPEPTPPPASCATTLGGLCGGLSVLLGLGTFFPLVGVLLIPLAGIAGAGALGLAYWTKSPGVAMLGAAGLGLTLLAFLLTNGGSPGHWSFG
jgi:hypothetical protein